MLKKEIKKIAQLAKDSAIETGSLSTELKNKVLLAMAKAIQDKANAIKRINQKDVALAKRRGLSKAMVDRLTLNDQRIKAMADSLRNIACLEDPVGKVIKTWKLANGLKIIKRRVPIGTIAIIYEARPNVTADCIGLLLKSGNCAVLRGGRESIHSNKKIYRILKEVIQANDLPEGAAQLVMATEHRGVDLLLKEKDAIDLVIPRGGEQLIAEVTRKSLIPVIKHYKGICHTYVDEYADLNMADKIAYNAKVQRPGVCNAMETLLVHEDVAARFLPHFAKRMKEAGVELRVCRKTKHILKNFRVKLARKSDFGNEFLDLILAIKVVSGLETAIDHINTYGSKHSDAIITNNLRNAQKFMLKVDSACLYHNASTRFTDGGQFGMGAEIGISTDKIHARGPMALEELCSYKYEIYGSGQVRK